MEEKEYFFTLRLKDGIVLAFWDYIAEAEAKNKCMALHNHYHAVMSNYRSPQDFKSIAVFLHWMKQDGFNGKFELSPI